MKKKSKSKMHRANKLSFANINIGKYRNLSSFLSQYRNAVQDSINYLCSNQITTYFKKSDSYSTFNFNDDSKLHLPTFLSYLDAKIEANISARAVCSAFEQAIDIVRSTISKRQNLIFKIQCKIDQGKEYKEYEYLQKLLDNTYTIPQISNSLPAKLSSKCVDFEFARDLNLKDYLKKDGKPKKRKFDLFLRLSSIGHPHIKIPLKLTRQFNKRSNWNLLKGIEVTENHIILVQETDITKIKTEGKTIGLDTGIKSVYTTSEGISSKEDIHGHSLSSIIDKMSHQKKGSKAFLRSTKHRKNYINWSINQLNFENINQINLEKINTFTGSRNRYLSHFAHRVISDKLMSKAEEQGVLVLQRSSAYKSQRCNKCGFVCKSNRVGKEYCCKHCGLIEDADLNAANNNELDLIELPYDIISLKLNVEGFFWKEKVITYFNGQEFRVPDLEKR